MKNEKRNEPSLTSMHQMVLEISHFKVSNLSKMDVAISKFQMKRNSFAKPYRLQSFKQIKQKAPEIFHFHFSLSCRIASVTLYLSENEAENLQNGDVHLAQIPDFKMEYLENHFVH